MKLDFRKGKREDAEACGKICYEAFKDVAERHGFPPDIPSVEVATHILTQFLSHPDFFGLVAEFDGRVVGSNFLDERSTIAGLGPITVDPAVQDKSVGRRLMQETLARARKRGFPGVRLVQAAYHIRSLCLYAKLGFEIREHLACMQGPPLGGEISGYTVRAASGADMEACNQLCSRVHGHDRAGELSDALKQGTASVVEHAGRVSGYTTGVAFLGHSVGETNEDLKALISAASEFQGPGFLLPTRNGELFRWGLKHGLRVVQPMTLMSLGLYNEPAAWYLPAVLY